MTPRWRVLVSSLHARTALERYRPLLESEGIAVIAPSFTQQYLPEPIMLDLVDDTLDGIVCSDDHVTARVIAKGSRLRVISKWGVGTDSIDRAAAAARGIAVYNTPRAFNDAVADLVLCHLLWFARRPDRSDAAVRAGRWEKYAGRALRGLTLGVVGVGNIGEEVARRAHAFGMRVLGCDVRDIAPAFLAETGMGVGSLHAVLGESDFVSLNCDLNAGSRHLLGEKEFAVIKRGAVLINTARGPVVDERALIRALEAGVLGGAALDVFEEEPLPADSPLRSFNNVVLSAHNAFNTIEAVEHVHDNTYRNLIRGLRADAAAGAAR